MRLLPRDDFCSHHPFFLCLVSEHGTANHIANGKDIRDRGLELLVHFHLPPFIDHNASSFEAKSFGEGFAPNRHQAVIARKPNVLPLFVFGSDGYFITLAFYPTDLMWEIEFDALFFHHFHQFFGKRTVHDWRNAIGIFHNGHFSTQSAIDLTELQSNHPTADHHQMLGDFS